MSRAAPLLRLTDGKWAVHPDGAALLSSITTPVCVVCVAGRYRTGKSFFLNSLAGNTAEKASAGFKVGSTSESCTRGIDVCVPEPSAATPACGGTLVLLDTEGLASMDQARRCAHEATRVATAAPHAPRNPSSRAPRPAETVRRAPYLRMRLTTLKSSRWACCSRRTSCSTRWVSSMSPPSISSTSSSSSPSTSASPRRPRAVATATAVAAATTGRVARVSSRSSSRRCSGCCATSWSTSPPTASR
eukprot:scaffold127937_cov72-Phaeocystis_antarctica.AAC.3